MDDHELTVMELSDRTGELVREPSQTKTGPENDLAAPQPSVSIPARKNDRLVDRHLDLLGIWYELLRELSKTQSLWTHMY